MSIQRLRERHERDGKVLAVMERIRHHQERAERERPGLIADAMRRLREGQG